MARPVQARTARTYAADVQVLTRLRSAVVLNDDLTEKKRNDLTSLIDSLIAELRPLLARAAK